MIKLKHAGKKYEIDYVKLMEEIDSYYHHDFGPGDLPTKRQDKKIQGVIVPHEVYRLTGPCLAWVYKHIAEHKFPKRYIFLLPDDSGSTLNYLTTQEDFESVFGICKIDKYFVKQLIQSGIVSDNQEFSSLALEYQLPFLQHASKDFINDVTIVPIIVPHTNNIQALVETIQNLDSDSVLIIVSNFTKYGPKYLFTPYKYNLELSQKDLDVGIIKYIQSFDSKGLQKFVARHKIQVSSVPALILGIEILKNNNAIPIVLSYYRSNKLDEDLENYVAFLGISF